MKEQTKFFLGADVSKPYFDISLLKVVDHVKQPMISERFTNDTNGMKLMHKWLQSHRVTFDQHSLLVIENTGIYHRLLWAYCSKHGLPIYIGNAAHIKWSFGIARGKNDVIDAQRLCNYARKHADELKATPPLNPVFIQLKDLLASRNKLLAQKTAIKQHLNELKPSNDPGTQKLIEKAHKWTLEGLSKSIKELESQIQQILRKANAIKGNYDLLLTIPGIGHLTALYIICCTNNFAARISGKQLASYAGVVPFEYRSGISIKGRNRVHSMANKELKALLHLCTLNAIRFYPEFKNYYDRKVNEGKHKMSVINAVRNKLALRVAAVVKNQRPYVENLAKAA